MKYHPCLISFLQTKEEWYKNSNHSIRQIIIFFSDRTVLNWVLVSENEVLKSWNSISRNESRFFRAWSCCFHCWVTSFQNARPFITCFLIWPSVKTSELQINFERWQGWIWVWARWHLSLGVGVPRRASSVLLPFYSLLLLNPGLVSLE